MLVSLYIENHPYLFKEEPQVLNFGGEYLYSFEKVGDEITITRKQNNQFIEGFFDIPKSTNVKIDLATAIVGQNGVGKSTIMNVIFKILEENTFENPKFYYLAIFEQNNEKLHLTNNEKVKISSELNFTKKKNIRKKIEYKTIYYSPHLTVINAPYFKEGDISISHRVTFDDSSSSETDSASTPEMHTLKLTHKTWVRYIDFLSQEIYQKRDIFQKILPNISDEKGLLTFNFKKLIYDKIIPPEHKKWVTKFLKSLGKSIDREDTKNILEDKKERLKLKFLQALITNMVYYTGKKEKETTSMESVKVDDFSDESEKLLERFLEYYSVNNETYDSETFINFKNLVFKAIEDHYFEEKKVNNPSEYCFKIPYDKIEEIKDTQEDIFKELKEFHKKTGREDVDTGTMWLVLIDFCRGLSSGEIAFLNIFSNLLEYIKENVVSKDDNVSFNTNYILLLDEGDLGFHPQWKKKYVNLLLQSLPYFFEEMGSKVNLQIIITTHDPLTLSDFPSSNVIFLKKEGIVTETTPSTFGANISELLANSFFLNDGLIGDFAKGKITEVIDWIKEVKKDKEEKKKSVNLEELEKREKVIELIDERVLKMKLIEMISELKENEDEFYNEQIEKEIERLKKLKRDPKK